jgi:hypothetical protein
VGNYLGQICEADGFSCIQNVFEAISKVFKLPGGFLGEMRQAISKIFKVFGGFLGDMGQAILNFRCFY